MSARILLFLVLASVALAQTVVPEPRFDVWLLLHADPKADLGRNVARGDLRFFCINLKANSRSCPGTASEERMATHGTRLIEDAGCVPRSEEHARAILKARDYAHTYNELLLDYLKSHQ